MPQRDRGAGGAQVGALGLARGAERGGGGSARELPAVGSRPRVPGGPEHRPAPAHLIPKCEPTPRHRASLTPRKPRFCLFVLFFVSVLSVLEKANSSLPEGGSDSL